MFRPSCRGAVAFSDHNSCACQPQKPQSPIRIAVSCGTGVTVTERFLGELLIRPAEVGSIDGSPIPFALSLSKGPSTSSGRTVNTSQGRSNW